MACASPSTNPSSCDSLSGIHSFSHQAQPSTSSESTAQTCSLPAQVNGDSSSPALAQSVPPHQEPHYPESTGRTMLITTKMLEAAHKDIEERKVENLREWCKRFYENIATVVTSLADSDVARKPTKRKASSEAQEEGSPEAKKAAAESTPKSQENEVRPDSHPQEPTETETQNDKENAPKTDENPLKRMEMMTASAVFKTSTSMKEVAIEGNEKKDERVKLERLEGIGKDLEAEQAKAYNHHQMMVDRARQQQMQQMLSPGMPPCGPQFPPGGRVPNVPMSMGPGMPPPYPGGMMPPMYPGPAVGKPFGPMPGMNPYPPMAMPPGMMRFPPMPMPGYPGPRPDMQASPSHPDYDKMLRISQAQAAAVAKDMQPGKSPSFYPPPGPYSHPGFPGMPYPGLPYPGCGPPPFMPMPSPMSFPRPMMPPGPLTAPIQPQQPSPSPLAGPPGGPRSQPPPMAANSPFYNSGHIPSTSSSGAPSAPPSMMFQVGAQNDSHAASNKPNSHPHTPSFWPGQLSDPNSLPGISMPPAMPLSTPSPCLPASACNAEATA